MNAASKAIAESGWNQGFMVSFSVGRQQLLMIILFVSVVLSALGVVYVKTLNRRLFSQLETEQVRRDHLHVDWGKLLLEQSTWATQARVQKFAQNELKMVTPQANHMVILKER